MPPSSSPHDELSIEVLIHGRTQQPRIQLGEGSMYDPRIQCVYYVDILGKTLFQYFVHEKRQLRWALPALSGTVVLTHDVKKVLLALADGLAWFHVEEGRVEYTGWTVESTPHDDMRCNDGKCNAQGQLIVGTMCLDEGDAGKERGAVYCVEESGKVTPLFDRQSIPNGLTWTRDGTRFFHTDTPTNKIRQFQVDAATGKIDVASAKDCIVMDEKTLGYPDGHTIDDADHLYVCAWSGGAVHVFDPTNGKLLRSLHLPLATRITSCTFGGPELRDLYVTSAAPHDGFVYTPEEENAGSLFVIRNAGQGLKPFYFGTAPSS